MTVRAGKINGKNLNYIDQDNSALDYALVNSGIVEGMAVTLNSVSIGRAILITKRTSVTPNQQFGVHIEITAQETIDTSGTKKVWIALNPTYINDGTLATAPMGTQLATVVTGASFPTNTEYYLPLASITGGVITDARVMLSGKPITRNGLTPSSSLEVDPTGAEVLRPISSASPASTDLIQFIDPTTRSVKESTYSALQNALSGAGKYVETAVLGEDITETTPVAMAIVNTITYSGSLISGTASTANRGFLYTPEVGAVSILVKTSKNSSSSSASIKLQDNTGTDIQTQAVASGSNTATFTYDFIAGTTYRIVMNDSANFTNNGDYLPKASFQAFFPYATNGISTGTVDTTNILGFNYMEVNYGGKALRARANRTIETQFAIFAGFVTGPKSKGDSVTLDANEGTVVGGFSSLVGGEYGIGNIPGIITTLPSDTYKKVGYALDSTRLTVSKKGVKNSNFAQTKTQIIPGLTIGPSSSTTTTTYSDSITILSNEFSASTSFVYGGNTQSAIATYECSIDKGVTWSACNNTGSFVKYGSLIRTKIVNTYTAHYNNGYSVTFGDTTATITLTS